MKLYQYPKCSTCRKAVKFLKDNNIEFESHDITLTPPSIGELSLMLGFVGDKKKLFNTSGVQYRELGMKDKLPSLSDDAALTLLSKNGKLIKRPFLLSKNVGLVGFKEELWLKTVAMALKT